MNLDDLSTQLLFTTVPIWARKSTGTETGTGFIYSVPMPSEPDRFIPLLVTNFHVIQGAFEAVIELVERSGDRPLLQKRVRAKLDSSLLQNGDQQLDIAIIPLGPLLNQLDAGGRPVFFRSVGPKYVPEVTQVEELSAVEDILFIGYPSGMRDEHNSTPLVRRGITATPVWNDFGDEPVFLIDAGVYPGSSGSPVFIANQGSYTTRQGLAIGTRLLFLGMITQTFVRTEPFGNAYLGLGKVVNSSALKDAIDRFAALVR